MRQWLVKIHLYCGLFCSSAILILGINSIMRNHHIPSPETARTPVKTIKWEAQISPDIIYSDELAAKHAILIDTWAQIKQKRNDGATHQELKPLQDIIKENKPAVYHESAKNVRDELGLVGWVPAWEVKRSNNGDLKLNVARPGKIHVINVSASDGSIKVEEKHQSAWIPIRAMHGLMGLPNSSMIAVWGWYTELSAWAFLIMIVTSLVIWAYRKKQRRMKLAVLSAAVVFSFAFMTYLWLVG